MENTKVTVWVFSWYASCVPLNIQLTQMIQGMSRNWDSALENHYYCANVNVDARGGGGGGGGVGVCVCVCVCVGGGGGNCYVDFTGGVLVARKGHFWARIS